MKPHTRTPYGGPGWSARTTSLEEELGTLWAGCGLRSEWEPLEAVLLHRPGAELERVDGGDPDASLMLESPDPARAASQHDALAEAYRSAGVTVHYVEPPRMPPPNQMFCADLMVMTPAGAILGRPASTVRAGEERWIARRLADLGIPLLRSVGGRGTFEGADACWLDPETVLLGLGLRTNAEGAVQVATTLAELGVDTIQVDLAPGVMHLMGDVRIVDRDLAFVREESVPTAGVSVLRERGYEVRSFPDTGETLRMAHNLVVLGPRKVVMPEGCPVTRQAYEDAGVEYVTVETGEIHKAAGGIGCLTAVLARAGAGG